MRYSRLELLIIIVGAAAVAASLLFTFQGQPVAEEVVAQILLVVVLIAAVHWGRNGGFVAATLASLTYILLRIPLVIELQGLNSDIVFLLVTRIGAYGLIGIVGGEICRRLKYLFARLESSGTIDHWSQVFNQRHISRALESSASQHERYGMPYTVVIFELAEGLTADLQPSRERMLVRGVASHLRNDTRLVDEAARLDDGRFVLLLPHTPRPNAIGVAERLHSGVCDALGARAESVTVTVLGAPEDVHALREFAEEIRIEPAQERSGS